MGEGGGYRGLTAVSQSGGPAFDLVVLLRGGFTLYTRHFRVMYIFFFSRLLQSGEGSSTLWLRPPPASTNKLDENVFIDVTALS